MTKRVTKDDEAANGALASAQLLEILRREHPSLDVGVVKTPSTISPRFMQGETILLGMNVLGETAPDSRPQYSRRNDLSRFRGFNTKRKAS